MFPKLNQARKGWMIKGVFAWTRKLQESTHTRVWKFQDCFHIFNIKYVLLFLRFCFILPTETAKRGESWILFIYVVNKSRHIYTPRVHATVTAFERCFNSKRVRWLKWWNFQTLELIITPKGMPKNDDWLCWNPSEFWYYSGCFNIKMSCYQYREFHYKD